MTSLFLCLALGQSDPRLDVRATLLQPRVTYAEFGAWVQKTSGAPVEVSPAIRDRKVTVLVENRPLREIMDHVAEASFVRWEPTKEGGYSLRLAEGVANEEARIVRLESDAWTAGVRREMDAMAEFSRYSPERLKGEIASVKDDMARLKKDETPAGRRALAVASVRYDRLVSFDGNPFRFAAGSVLASLSPSMRAGIIAGQPVFAVNRSVAGFAPLSSEAVEGIAKQDRMIKADDTLLFSLRYDAARRGLWLVERPLKGGGSAQIVDGNDRDYRTVIDDEPLAKRLKAWATTDDAILATRIAPASDRKEPARPTPYRALGELLVDLHERTGLPIVADGYRVAVVARHPPQGGDVKAWLGSLGQWSDYRFRGYRPLVRAQDGWLMMRHPRYWQQLGREIPEGPIRTLEAAARRPEGFSLDDFTRFAGTLDAAQAPWTTGQDLVMDAPNKTLEHNVPFLQLWNRLSTSWRRTATTPQGLAGANLPYSVQTLFAACLDERRGSLFDASDEASLRRWVLGTEPIPNDVRLFVDLDTGVMSLDTEDLTGGWGYDSVRDGDGKVPGVVASFGTPADRSYASFSVPLRPAKPVRANG